MRLRNIPGSQDVIDHSPYVIKDAEKRRGSWRELFRNDHPLHIEVGMGKGRFLMELAARNPDINFVGKKWRDCRKQRTKRSPIFYSYVRMRLAWKRYLQKEKYQKYI